MCGFNFVWEVGEGLSRGWLDEYSYFGEGFLALGWRIGCGVRSLGVGDS